MKLGIKMGLLLLFAAWCSSLIAADFSLYFEKPMEVSMEWVNAPRVNFSGASSRGDTNKTNRYLAITARYFPLNAKKKGKDAQRFVDNVRMYTEVVFQIEDKNDRKKGMELAILDGSSTIWNIPLDGKSHRMMMLIPPEVINRFTPDRMAGSDLPVTARVTLTSSAGVLLSSGFATIAGGSRSKAVTDDEKDKKEYDTLALRFVEENWKRYKPMIFKGAVLPRSKTLWAFLDEHGDYDAERDLTLSPLTDADKAEEANAGSATVPAE